MINPFFEKLAKLAVNYSLNIKEGDRVFIQGPTIAEELFQALYVEILKAGGHPTCLINIEGKEEFRYKYASKEQLEYVDNVNKAALREIDCLIEIFADYNPKKLSMVDPSLIATARGSSDRLEIIKTLMARLDSGELRYLVVPFPCHAFAQEANMDLYSYTEFVENALLFHKEDPIKEWQEIDQKQEKICNYLNSVDQIQVLGEDTDLTLSVKGRKWVNCCGHLNLPDGEVFTGPIEDSVNGHIRFTFPGVYEGNEIEDISLTFKDGKVVKATAKKGEELLHEVLAIENADRLGEFAIGTNYGIQKFTKNMLFDEKIGGTLHCAIGAGLPETGSQNHCPIHWDILKDLKTPGSKIIADGKVIYEEGKWLI